MSAAGSKPTGVLSGPPGLGSLRKLNEPNRPVGPGEDLEPRATSVLGARDHQTSPATDRLIADSVPPATRRARDYVLGEFGRWCDEAGRVALPATAQTLADYVTFRVALDAAPATLEQAIGLIRGEHKRRGHPGAPDTTAALAVLRRHKQLRAADRRSQKQAPPLDKPTLLHMIEAGDTTTVRGRRDQLLLVLGWQMMARRAELVAVQDRDVTDGPDGLDIWIPRAKTDPHGAGRTCSLPPNPDPDFDPVRVLRRWRALLAEHGRTGGPLLWGVTKADTLAGTPLSAHGVNRIVQTSAARAKIPDAAAYTAHSLRAGGLVDALTRGVPPGIAARHGGWDPESPMLGRYARAANRWKHNAMAGA